MTHLRPTITTVLSVPGPWGDEAQLAAAISETTPTFILHARTLRDTVSGNSWSLELSDHDPDLRASYQSANRSSLTPAELNRIGRHVGVAYLIASGGSLDAARKMMHATSALLQAGGFAVKVESAGVAHGARDWLAQSARRDTHEGALYIAYVALVGGGDNYYSCGMHNLGLPDAIVSATIDVSRAGELLRDFLMSLVHDPQRQLADGTIITDVTGAHYKLTHESCRAYPPDDLFFNPFGMWRLTQQ